MNSGEENAPGADRNGTRGKQRGTPGTYNFCSWESCNNKSMHTRKAQEKPRTKDNSRKRGDGDIFKKYSAPPCKNFLYFDKLQESFFQGIRDE